MARGKGRLGVKRTPNLKAVEALGLPTPRLQIRWEALPPLPYNDEHNKMKRRIAKAMGVGKPAAEYRWAWHYELVLGLDTNDIRNPYEYKKPGELTLALGGGIRTSGRDEPINFDGTVDTPFRDGAHAIWDGLQLGRPPVYAICGERVTTVAIDWDKKMHIRAERAKEAA